MSSARGSGETKRRPQKHKNTFAFKNDLHDKTPQMKRINALTVSEVCQRCKDQIEWKIKYKKYKPLSQAKTCIRCSERKVKKAYHVACKECASKERCCAKCLKSADQVDIEAPPPTPSEEIQLKVEMDRLIKSLPERKRRTFLRFMKKGRNNDALDDDTLGNIAEKQSTENLTITGDEHIRKKRVPHSRDELLVKIEALRMSDDERESSDSDDFDSDND